MIANNNSLWRHILLSTIFSFFFYKALRKQTKELKSSRGVRDEYVASTRVHRALDDLIDGVARVRSAAAAGIAETIRRHTPHDDGYSSGGRVDAWTGWWWWG